MKLQGGQPLDKSNVQDDVRKGFVYKRVPHLTLGAIANCEELKQGMSIAEINQTLARKAEVEVLFDQPFEDVKKIRVCGPCLSRCQAGANRSGLVMAVLLMIEGYTATDAIQLIRQQRGPQALFNSDFVEKLTAYSRQEHNSPD